MLSTLHEQAVLQNVETISLIKDNFIIVCYLIVASRLSALAFIQLHNCFNKWETMSLLNRREEEQLELFKTVQKVQWDNKNYVDIN